MRHTPRYLMTDPAEVKRLIRRHPWATFVSPASTGLIASHYPVLLDESHDDITVVSHFGRPDETLHELGSHQVLVIIQGPHDYISPSWYPAGDVIPTWNHVTAHLYGTPEILDDEENYRMLSRLTDHFEHQQPAGRSLAEDEELTRRTAKGTVGLRIQVERFEARAKLSQNKDQGTVENITRQLEDRNPDLADEMRRFTQQQPADRQPGGHSAGS